MCLDMGEGASWSGDIAVNMPTHAPVPPVSPQLRALGISPTKCEVRVFKILRIIPLCPVEQIPVEST